MKPVIQRVLAAFTVGLIASVSTADALPPLNKNERVVQEFLAAAIGDEIRNNCPSIHARYFYVLKKASELKAYAISLGYSDEDIRVLRKSPENRALLKQMRDDYLSENGVTPGDAESYCRLGRQEMENETLIGSLLWGG